MLTLHDALESNPDGICRSSSRHIGVIPTGSHGKFTPQRHRPLRQRLLAGKLQDGRPPQKHLPLIQVSEAPEHASRRPHLHTPFSHLSPDFPQHEPER